MLTFPHIAPRISGRWAFPLLLAVCVFAVAARSQDEGGIRVNVSLVLLDATVEDKAGQIMDKLKKEDFEVREDGALQKVALFGRDEMPLHVALVVDLSDSIGPFFAPLKEAAATTLGALKADDDVALFTFSTKAELRVPLTQDKTAIADQFDTFRVGGATNINDGIFVAAEYLLKTAPKGRRAIILISDDVATFAGGSSTSDIITEATAADTAVYNLKVPGYNPLSTRFAAAEVPGLVNLRKVTEATGGEIFDVPEVKSLDSVFQALVQRLKTRYTLGYYTSANGATGKPHKLDVRLVPSFGAKGKNYKLLARSAFYVIP